MLVVCIFASALGALIMCLLVMRAGFPSLSADPARVDQDLLITRVGHAAAGVCFAITAIIATILIARMPVRPVVAASDPNVNARIAALDHERQALGDQVAALQATVRGLREQIGTLDGGAQTTHTRIEQTEARVAKTEERLANADAALARAQTELAKTDAGLKRLADEMTQANARAARQAERAAVRSAATPARETPPARETTPARETVVPAPSRETVVPAPGAREIVIPPGRTPARRSLSDAERSHESASPSTPDPVVSPQPSTPSHIDAAPTHPAPAAAPASKSTASAAASARKAAPENLPETTLTDKVRKDWDTIRRGFESAGGEISSAMRKLGRRVGGRE